MSETANDLAVDLLWFFDSHSWQPDLIGLQVDFDLSALKLGCALTFITDEKNKELPLVSTWQTAVRNLMKDLGFYTGKFKSPDRNYYLKKLPEKKLSFAEPKGAAAYVFVTVKNPHKDDRPACAYANTAIAKSTQKTGGILVEIKRTEGLSKLWARLREDLKNRRVLEMHFFDHGVVEQQQVGGDMLTADSTIPDDVGSRFAAGAEIRLHGCQTLLKKVPGQKDSRLATNLGSHLLVRGGNLFGLSKDANLDYTNMKVLDSPNEDWVPYNFYPCNGSVVMDEILKLMRGMKGNYKVKYSSLPSRQGAQAVTADLLDYPADYPADYPNIGYYT